MDWANLLDSVEAALIIINSEGQLLYFNKPAQRFLVLQDSPLQLGENLFDSIPHQNREFVSRSTRDALEFRRHSFMNVQYADKKGIISYFEMRYSPLTTEEGLNNIFIEVRDVTQQKIFENKITSIAKELSGLIENANAIIIGIDALGYITEWNKVSSKITGYLKNEALIQSFTNFIVDKGQSLNFSLAMNEVLSGHLISNYELPIVTKDCRKLTLLINATPRKNESGQVIGILLVGQDITELLDYRKNLENVLDDRTKALKASIQNEKELIEIKNRFISVASHEFRSPLSLIQHEIKWIKANLGQMDKAMELKKLDNIQSRAQQMSVMLEDLLTINKNDEVTLKPNFTKVELLSFFKTLIREVEINTKHSHFVRVDFPPQAIEIESDTALLKNIFLNLLNNAIKYSPEEKEIFLSVVLHTHNNSVEIRTRDKGIGIEQNEFEKIFEPFVRGKNADRIKGTGLGLSIVKSAVDLLGGNLTFESKLGIGSEFIVIFNINYGDER